MFKGPGPLPIIQLPSGFWVRKDQKTYDRDWREHEEMMAKNAPPMTASQFILALLFSTMVSGTFVGLMYILTH